MTFQTSVEFDRAAPEKDSDQQKPVQSLSRWPQRFAATVLRWLSAIKSFILISVSREQQKQIVHASRFLFATEGQTFERSFCQFRATPAGRDLLQRRPDFRAFCRNREMLKACPPESLGRRYAEFLTIHGLNEEHYLGAVIQHAAPFADDPERAWFHTRVDASHDVRHVLTGYGPEFLGEICLLWFRFGQIRHFGILTLALFGSVGLMITRRGPLFRLLWEAYWRGRRAGLLDQSPWENGLALPLSAHRAALGITPPKHYPNSFAPEAYVSGDAVVLQKGRQQSVVAGKTV